MKHDKKKHDGHKHHHSHESGKHHHGHHSNQLGFKHVGMAQASAKQKKAK